MKNGKFRGALASVIAGSFATIIASSAAQAEAITVVLNTEPDQLDPCQIAKSQVGPVNKGNIIETLTEVDPEDGTVTPRLATSWERVDDTTWRFDLREDVAFHDGTPLTAEAVAYSLERTLVPELACESAVKYFAGVDVEGVPVDENTIEFTTSAPVEILPTMLSSVGISSLSTPITEITRDPVGTGPYVLSEWNPGRSIVLTAFDGYWGESPEVSQATFVWRADSTIRAAMVAAGEADIAPRIASQDATNPEMDFGYATADTASFRIDAMIPPLDDVRVRRALNLAIDRDAMRGTLLSEEVIPAAQQVPPGTNGYNTSLNPYPYDPDEARRLLAEAKADGVPVDAEIVLIGRFNIYPGAEEVIEAVQAMLIEVGLDVSIKMTEAAEWFELALKPFPEGRAPNIFQTMHDNTLGDAVFTLPAKYHSEQSQATIDVPELDNLIDEASSASGEERRELFSEAIRMIHEDIVPDIMLFHMVSFARVNPRISYEPTIATNSELQLADISFN